MKVFGLQIMRAKDYSVDGGGRSLWNLIQEPFSGAWQRNITQSRQSLLAFSAVYACVRLIAGDISKLRIRLMQQDAATGVWTEVLDVNSPYIPVLRKPNEYQTTNQFLSAWQVSRLLWGNAYILIRRDSRQIVTRLYVLDPRLVTPKVADSGEVFYALNRDPLSSLDAEFVISSDDIMHDRMICLFHPLVGVSPIYACATTTAQGLAMQDNSAKFFSNMSRPSGMLTSPDKITDAKALQLKAQFESAMSGNNIGRLLVAGDGLKYEQMMMSAVDAQLIEQLKWSVEDVARAFQVPVHKIAAATGQPFANIASQNQDYYSHTLQEPIEAIEALLNVGLGVDRVPAKTYGTQLELEGLLRMDPLSRAERHAKLVGAGIESPNEARASEDLLPTDGGETPYMQQQNYALSALAKRDSGPDPFGKAAPKAPALPAPVAEQPSAKSLADALIAKFGGGHA